MGHVEEEKPGRIQGGVVRGGGWCERTSSVQWSQSLQKRKGGDIGDVCDFRKSLLVTLLRAASVAWWWWKPAAQ